MFGIGKFNKAAMIEEMGQELELQDTRLQVLRDSLAEYIKENTDLQYQLETDRVPLEDLGKRGVRIVIRNSRESRLMYHTTFEVSFEPKFKDLHGYEYHNIMAITRILSQFPVHNSGWVYVPGLLTKTFTVIDSSILIDMDHVEAKIQYHLTQCLLLETYGKLIAKEVHHTDGK